MTTRETPDSPNADEGRQAGRGGLAVLVAKVFFILSGLVQQALLPRMIGRDGFGALGRVSTVSNVFNNVVVSSSTQGVSRVVAAAGAFEREAFRAALRVHLGIAAIATGLLVAAAPLAAHLQQAREVLAPLVVMAGVLAVYALYAPLVGYINGRRLFVRQASLDMLAATLRTAGILGCGWLFVRYGAAIGAAVATLPGVLGAAIGSVLAAIGVCLVAVRWTGTGKSFSGARPDGVPTPRAYLGLIVPVMVAQLCVNVLMQSDLFLVGRYLSIAAREAIPAAPGGVIVDPAKAANEWVGVYRACQLFAFLPYQLLFSVTQVLFPMLARARAEEGDARVAELVSRGSRIGAIVCGLLVFVIVAMPESLIRFAYDKETAAAGAPVLRVLVLGQAGFAMFGLATTILVSLGRERAAMVLTALASALLIGACMFLVPRAAFGGPQLFASATAAAVALAIALGVGTAVARSAAGAFIPVPTALRVAACVAAAAFAGLHMPAFSRPLTIVIAAGLAGAYVVLLVLTRELKREDLSLALSILMRRAKR